MDRNAGLSRLPRFAVATAFTVLRQPVPTIPYARYSTSRSQRSTTIGQMVYE